MPFLPAHVDTEFLAHDAKEDEGDREGCRQRTVHAAGDNQGDKRDGGWRGKGVVEAFRKSANSETRRIQIIPSARQDLR